jgi:exonuclease III
MEGTEGEGGGGYRLQAVVHGDPANRNGVGILINKSLKYGVVDVKRCGDQIIMVKVVFGDLVLNVISAYAPQVGHNENTKREFREEMEDLVRSVPSVEKFFIRGDLNGHTSTSNIGFEGVHGALAMALEIKNGKMS